MPASAPAPAWGTASQGPPRQVVCQLYKHAVLPSILWIVLCTNMSLPAQDCVACTKCLQKRQEDSHNNHILLLTSIQPSKTVVHAAQWQGLSQVAMPSCGL